MISTTAEGILYRHGHLLRFISRYKYREGRVQEGEGRQEGMPAVLRGRGRGGGASQIWRREVVRADAGRKWELCQWDRGEEEM